MGQKHPLFRLGRAIMELTHAVERLPDDLADELDDEIAGLFESIALLNARCAQLAGAPDDEIARMLDRSERAGEGES